MPPRKPAGTGCRGVPRTERREHAAPHHPHLRVVSPEVFQLCPQPMPAALAAQLHIAQHDGHLSGSNRLKSIAAASAMLTLCSSVLAAPHAGETEFRALYKELVETNTSLSAGDCTLAAQRMAAHLGAAGFAEERARGLRAAGPSEGRRAGRGLSRTRHEAQGDAAAGAYRRGRSETRGLDPRSVHAHRGGRQVLRARRGRRQGRGRDFRGFPGAAARREIQAAPHHQARAHLRRGNQRARSMARTGSSKIAANSSMPNSW